MLTFELQNAVDANFRNGETFTLEGATGIVADYIAIRNAFTLAPEAANAARLEWLADAMVSYTMLNKADRLEAARLEALALIA